MGKEAKKHETGKGGRYAKPFDQTFSKFDAKPFSAATEGACF